MIATPHDFMNLVIRGAKTGFLQFFNRERKLQHIPVTAEATYLLKRGQILGSQTDVWFAPGIRKEPHRNGKRGTAQDVARLNGLFVDIDCRDEAAHAAANLCPDKLSAGNFLMSHPLEPTFIIDTGHGVHGWWFFDEPWLMDGQPAIDDYTVLNAGFQRYFQAQADEHGWKLDTMNPLVGLARLPGTVNRKVADRPAPVEIIHTSGRLYSRDHIAQYLYHDEILTAADHGPLTPHDPPRLAGQGELPILPTVSPADEAKREREKIKLALNTLPGRLADDYESWIRVGLMLRNAGEHYLEDWIVFSKASAKFKPGECEKAWAGFKPGGGLTIASLFALADQHDAGWRSRLNNVTVFETPEGLWAQPPEKWSQFSGLTDNFPMELIPNPYRSMIEEVAQTYSVTKIMAAMTCLGVVSVACGKNYEIRIKDDYTQLSNLYILLAVAPGVGKSPVMRPFQAPLVDYVQARMPEYEREMQEYHARIQAIKSQKQAVEDKIRMAMKRDPSRVPDLKGTLDQLEGEIGPTPTEPCLFLNDATSEAMARRMAANGGFIGEQTSEGRKVLEIARGKYSGTGSDVSLWLAGHGYDYYRQDRVNRASFVIESPCIAALIMTQPDSLRELGENASLRESGFLARWLYVVPETEPQAFCWDSVEPKSQKEYHAEILKLIKVFHRQQYHFSPLAAGCWGQFFNECKELSASDAHRSNPFLATWLSKLPENTARLALLLHVMRDSNDPAITHDEAEAAIKIGRLLFEHARQTQRLMVTTDGTSQAHEVYRWLDENRPRLNQLRSEEDLESTADLAKSRDVYSWKVAGIKTRDEAHNVLEILHAKGWVKRAFIRTTVSKRLHECYIVRPRTALYD